MEEINENPIIKKDLEVKIAETIKEEIDDESLLYELGELICKHKVKEEREEYMTLEIYVVRQYAYVHWRR